MVFLIVKVVLYTCGNVGHQSEYTIFLIPLVTLQTPASDRVREFCEKC